MASEPMTLIERLRNPQWVHDWSPSREPELDKEQTRHDMQEAADELERLKLKKRPVAFRVKGHRGEWVYFEYEEDAVTFSGGNEYQGLFVRDGT